MRKPNDVRPNVRPWTKRGQPASASSSLTYFPRPVSASPNEDDRTRCLACRGCGCHACNATGLVCPICRGMRFLRRDLPVGHPDFGKIARCDGCCEGNQINPDREAQTIRAYLATEAGR